MNQLLERLLPQVQKPARYTGGEYNQIVKDKSKIDVRVAFCFPDTYEIGMSNIGMRILYGLFNQPENVWCERVFAPWGDMEALMREHNLPLWALESGDPVADFDMIAFSVGYEMSYTNLLNMLDLSGIPLRSADRTELRHMVFAGGTCMYNPEPLADFLDFCILGEGEEVNNETVALYARAKREGWDKPRFLREVSQIPGVYVPSLYHYEWNEDGTIASITPLDGAPATVTKRIISDLDAAYYPTNPIVPSTEIVHDRASLEIFRGCIRGCRFCQAGFVYRPIRPKHADTLIRQGVQTLENTGYDEITLASLSTSDYRELPEFADQMLDYCNPRQISLSLPSLRADNFSRELMEKVQSVRKSGLTFAPEAGTQRLRDAINKNLSEEEILSTCATAFSGGWSNVKLYFMLGLPTETDDDVRGIAELANKILQTWKENSPMKKHGVNITVSTAYFIPKPFTPFQWEAQITPEEYNRRVNILRDSIRSRNIQYHWHETELSVLEAVLARGDRRLCAVLEQAVRNGAKLDAWREYFRYDAWTKAFADCGIDPAFYAHRERGADEIFPWEPISIGVRRDFFARERERAYAACASPNCREKCAACGARALNGGVCDA
jgi:radical SAM family uncharacterized protein